MAKKQKEETPNVNATANRDIVQRLNFLYQASVYLQSVDPFASAVPSSTSKSRRGKERQIEKTQESEAMAVDDSMHSTPPMSLKESGRRKNKRKFGTRKTTGDLARSYVQCMRVVGQKTTVKIDPSLKRSLCSNCSTTLVPGSSASVRVKNSPCHGHIVVYTCLHCKTKKQIPAPPNTNPTPITFPSLNSHLPEKQEPTPLPGSSDALASHPSSVDPGRSKPNLRKKKPPMLHPLPLFARPDAGHVVFRGNERTMLDEDSGFGVCFA
ncbi:RNAse P Rpr2/Rpp21/SNM1 subunit domain-containing protein [Flammula alnicola]|nr:RNAse P Rpr2/Rpp21/SNM1 subunit domain-containing protein [Flammula alnicola]